MDTQSKQSHSHRGSRRTFAGVARVVLAGATLAIGLSTQALPALAFNPQPDPPGLYPHDTSVNSQPMAWFL